MHVFYDTIIVKKNKQNNRRHSYEKLEKLSLAFNLPSNPHSATPPRRWLVGLAVTNYQQINKIPPSHHSGKEENDWKLRKIIMKKFAKLGFALGIACSLMVSTVAFADFVDGGEWHYGVGWTGTYGYSNYHHPTRSHTATVKNGQHENRQHQGAGIWAKASITKIPPTGMEYFYGF